PAREGAPAPERAHRPRRRRAGAALGHRRSGAGGRGRAPGPSALRPNPGARSHGNQEQPADRRASRRPALRAVRGAPESERPLRDRGVRARDAAERERVEVPRGQGRDEWRPAPGARQPRRRARPQPSLRRARGARRCRGVCEHDGARTRGSERGTRQVGGRCGGCLPPSAPPAEPNGEEPMSSALLLTPGEGEDGRLEVRELFGLDLHARLVVLSACETGLGKLSRGDDLIGLQRAFLYAGTPTVVTTLWKVDDRASFLLMREFYSR